MLTSVVFSLELRSYGANDGGGKGIELPATAGRAIYSLVLGAIAQVDPKLAERLHASGSQPRQPVRFTTSPLQGPLTPTAGGRSVRLDPQGEYWLRVTGLDREVSEQLLELCETLPARGQQWELLGVPLEVVGATAKPEEHPWAAQIAYADLYRRWVVECPRPPRRLGLQFLSPTTFRKGKRNFPFPLPRLVFLTLAEKWNAFSPVHLGADLHEVIDGAVELARYELRTRVLRFPHGPETGFVGRCEYRLLLDRTTAEGDTIGRLLHLLADFAFFAGVGAKTAMGMGQTRREPFASPHRSQAGLDAKVGRTR